MEAIRKQQCWTGGLQSDKMAALIWQRIRAVGFNQSGQWQICSVPEATVMMMIAAGGRKAPKKQSRLSSVCADSSVLGKDEGAWGFHRPSPDRSDTKVESVHDAAHKTAPSERMLALTRIVHDVNIGPQFRAGQVVAVLDRIIEGRQQDEQDHGVDELREAE